MSATGTVMLDLAGTALDHEDRRRLRHPSTGAVILFARNFESKQQVSALTEEIRAVRADILISVDHEGGRVQRFRGAGFTALPEMARLGRIVDDSDGPELASQIAHAAGYVMARELHDCGVDFSFAPVLDLDYGQSAVIGERAFSRDFRRVALLARALIGGQQQGGMANCGKHFPGHGFAAADSHVDVPVDDRSFDQIFAADIAPYACLQNALLAVMPAHVIYSRVDPLPAGFSSFWLRQVLRQQLGFQGAIFSDDLAMAGAHVVGDVITRAKAALGAGCDMVLICNRPNDADDLLAGLHLEVDPASATRLRRMARCTPVGLADSQHDPVYHGMRTLLQPYL